MRNRANAAKRESAYQAREKIYQERIAQLEASLANMERIGRESIENSSQLADIGKMLCSALQSVEKALTVVSECDQNCPTCSMVIEVAKTDASRALNPQSEEAS